MACYVCGSTDVVEGADPRSPTCALDVAARGHTVSMRRDSDTLESLAVCACGWRHNAPWADRWAQQDRAIREHWLAQRSVAS